MLIINALLSFLFVKIILGIWFLLLAWLLIDVLVYISRRTVVDRLPYPSSEEFLAHLKECHEFYWWLDRTECSK